jgi:hypothetical protein
VAIFEWASIVAVCLRIVPRNRFWSLA